MQHVSIVQPIYLKDKGKVYYLSHLTRNPFSCCPTIYTGPICKNTPSSPCLLPCYDYQGTGFGSSRDDADGASDVSASAEWELTRQSISAVSLNETSQYRMLIGEVDSDVPVTDVIDDRTILSQDTSNRIDGDDTAAEKSAEKDEAVEIGGQLDVKVTAYADGKWKKEGPLYLSL